MSQRSQGTDRHVTHVEEWLARLARNEADVLIMRGQGPRYLNLAASIPAELASSLSSSEKYSKRTVLRALRRGKIVPYLCNRPHVLPAQLLPEYGKEPWGASRQPFNRYQSSSI